MTHAACRYAKLTQKEELKAGNTKLGHLPSCRDVEMKGMPSQCYICVADRERKFSSTTEMSWERPPGGGDTRAVVKKQGWHPSTGEWRNKMGSIHTMECYLAIKKNEVLI